MPQTFTQIARQHADQDMLRKGSYGRMNGGFHGCSVGCFLHDYEPDATDWSSNPHARVAKHSGIAEWALHVQDYLFENLPDPELWHVECAELYDAFGGDWDVARHKFMARTQREVVANPTAINERVAALHDRAAAGDMPSDEEWSAAWSAAESAESSAEWSAAKSAAKSAEWSAESAAASAEWSAKSAASSAARSAAKSAEWSEAESAAKSATKSAEWSAAWSAAWSAIKNLFIETLSE